MIQPFALFKKITVAQIYQPAPFPADIHSTAFRSLRVLFPGGTPFWRVSVLLTFPLWDTFQVVRPMTLLNAGNLHKASPSGKRTRSEWSTAKRASAGKGAG